MTKIARMASGASGAELANIVNEGGAACSPRSAQCICDAGRPRREHRGCHCRLPEEERDPHRCTKSASSLITRSDTHWWQRSRRNSAPVQKITIIPRTSGALGYTMQVEEGNHYLMSKEEARKQDCDLDRRSRGRRSAVRQHFNRRFQRHRAGDQAGARNDYALRHGQRFRYGCNGNGHQPVLGWRHLSAHVRQRRRLRSTARSPIWCAGSIRRRRTFSLQTAINSMRSPSISTKRRLITGEEFMKILNGEETPTRAQSE